MNRKKYWNESYLSYWKMRVEEAGTKHGESMLVKGDIKTESNDIYKEIFSLTPPKEGNLLDVGCAWGRMFEIYKSYGLEITGVDISSAMIERAKELWKADPSIKSLLEAEAEDLPFPESSFDNICCFAVFDATFQNIALAEFLRTLRRGGYLYLTGKNTNYFANDSLALNAEIGARRKMHPNYFTDVELMIRKIKEDGHEIVDQYYFPRRGDFAEFNFTSTLPHNFYEYLIIIRRGFNSGNFEQFSSEFSLTFSNQTKLL